MMIARRNVWFGLVAALAVGGVGCSGANPQADLGSQNNGTANLVAASAYAVSPNLNTDRCLTSLGGATDNGTPVVLADCDGSAAQAWSRPTTDANKLALLGNKCLDVVDGVDGNGTKLQLWDCTPNNDNQRWVLQGGQLQWLGHSRCLDVTDGLVATDGTVMQIWDCTSYNDNQMWQLTSLPSEPNVASTGNEVVAGGNQVVAGGNQIVAGGNVVVPPVTYVAVDITHASSAFRAAIQAMVSQGDPTLCATVQGFPTAAVLGAQTCINAGSQHFIFDGNGRISYPSQNLSLNGVYYDKGSYCLGVGMAGKPTAGQPVLVPCNSGDNSQMWAQAGNVLVSLPNKTCLGFDPNGQSPNSIRLGACTTRPQYGWTLQN